LKEALFLIGNALADLLTHRVVAVLLGGATGTYLRYVLGKWIGRRSWAQGFPFGTLIINVSGSFILGAAATLLLDCLPPGYENWYLLVGTGFCGGYTTFSTFELETLNLIRDGSWRLALVNVVASLLLGFLGVVLGVGLVSAVLPGR